MKKMLLFIFILLFPISSEAAYKIFLKDGSVISGVHSYVKKEGEVIAYLRGGSMWISEKDILNIEGTETLDFEEDTVRKEQVTQEKPVSPEEPSTASEASSGDKGTQVNSLMANLDALNTEIRSLESEEARLAASINEARGKFTYNFYQARQVERETEPLQQQLIAVQQKKSDLVQRKAALEAEIRSLQ